MNILCECGHKVVAHPCSGNAGCALCSCEKLEHEIYEAAIAARDEKLEAAAEQWTLNAYAPLDRPHFRIIKTNIREDWPALAETLDALAALDAEKEG